MNEAHAVAEPHVIQELEAHPYLKRRNVRFETSEGRVIMRGVVSSYYQKAMAQEIVRRTKGIGAVDNELEVAWS